ncbi:unnamed protein product [Caenorhabditis brenneri]
MEGAILTKELHNLICVRYEFHQGKSVFDGYKNFCKIVGDDAMEYRDFDFWWHRFAKGEFDLSYDRSKDPKMRELLDMPIDIMEEILKKLEHGERSMFRYLSKACRQTFDSLNYTFKKVELTFTAHSAKLLIGNYAVQYCRRKCSQPKVRSGTEPLTVRNKVDKQPWRKALEEFNQIFKNPKHRIQELYINYKGKIWQSAFITQSLKSLGHQLNVNSYKFKIVWRKVQDIDRGIQARIMEHLTFLKAGVLEDLSFECEPLIPLVLSRDMFFEEIINTDQWKQAKRLTTNFHIANISDLMHFRSLDINFGLIDRKDAMYIRNSCKTIPEFEECSFRGFFDDYKGFIEEFLHSGEICCKGDYYQDGFLRISGNRNRITFEKIN